ncbi:hypothetical protein SISNIDRAFT_457862 [Sistotremastrum niveocremeum HHB9708]|uniref:Uncharacterized protein n=1 Tax=Sistotremastrum niveocremeum HHB9708 TaxID=1314777 RepID=A0A164R8A1_9AGAM|nr:hypothetical protein SISNIDRAFT_457862 [Sistotremastrum niveocremeum HHB9708]
MTYIDRVLLLGVPNIPRSSAIIQDIVDAIQGNNRQGSIFASSTNASIASADVDN